MCIIYSYLAGRPSSVHPLVFFSGGARLFFLSRGTGNEWMKRLFRSKKKDGLHTNKGDPFLQRSPHHVQPSVFYQCLHGPDARLGKLKGGRLLFMRINKIVTK